MDKSLYASAHETFSYDKDTGVLTRKKGQWSGFVQSSKDNKGYIITYLDGKTRRAHRLIWVMHYNETAPAVIDHINGITSDNRICNLRAATISENTSNRRKAPIKKSGLPKGVRTMGQRFIATIYKDNKLIYSEHSFPTILEAALSYNSLAKTHHGDFAQVNSDEVLKSIAGGAA